MTIVFESGNEEENQRKKLKRDNMVMDKQIFYVEAENCKLYCEKRGSGPLL